MKVNPRSTVQAEEILEMLCQENPDLRDMLDDQLSAADQVSAYFVADFCHSAAPKLGLSPHEVYDQVFNEREFRLNLTVKAADNDPNIVVYDATFEFPDEDGEYRPYDEEDVEQQDDGADS